jgi:hypothetical protein
MVYFVVAAFVAGREVTAAAALATAVVVVRVGLLLKLNPPQGGTASLQLERWTFLLTS